MGPQLCYPIFRANAPSFSKPLNTSSQIITGIGKLNISNAFTYKMRAVKCGEWNPAPGIIYIHSFSTCLKMTCCAPGTTVSSGILSEYISLCPHVTDTLVEKMDGSKGQECEGKCQQFWRGRSGKNGILRGRHLSRGHRMPSVW